MMWTRAMERGGEHQFGGRLELDEVLRAELLLDHGGRRRRGDEDQLLLRPQDAELETHLEHGRGVARVLGKREPEARALMRCEGVEPDMFHDVDRVRGGLRVLRECLTFG